MSRSRRPALPAAALAAALVVLTARPAPAGAQAGPLGAAPDVEILRTEHGVPHIRARTLAGAAYAMAWVQSEDYGAQVAVGIVRARGTMGLLFGRDSIEGDFAGRRRWSDAVAKFHTLDRDIREVYEGFAAGLNRYVETHRAEFPPGMPTDFTGYDILAREAGVGLGQAPARFLARMQPPAGARAGGGRGAAPPADAEGDAGFINHDGDGSNAWAFAPSRTRSGKAILLRNPHLSWTAGYYEAQLTVPGVVDFYGDFRIGGPIVGVGGFNRDLGFATTNNDPVLGAIYELRAAPGLADHYLLDGAALPLIREPVTVRYRSGDAIASETREFWRTPFGPVILRTEGRIYVQKSAGDGDVRESLQYLRLMQARTLDDWKAAMRMRARVTSNFTYADRRGNIFYVWNASLPDYPHPLGGDTLAIPVTRTADLWTRYVPFDSLPQLLNPRGGYLQQANDPPQFTTAQQPIDLSAHPAFYPTVPRLSLRSQQSIRLAESRRRMSLEEVLTLKHDDHMLLAERVKGDLVAAVRATAPTGDVAAALALVEQWDGRTAADRRGAPLFELWWRRYTEGAGFQPYAQPWRADAPLTTPRGLADPARAARAFADAVLRAVKDWGRVDVTWGETHRFRVGALDLPGNGCWGDMGCFRTMWWRPGADNRWQAAGGDGWIIGIEFGDVPRALSVLAYGQSNRADSPLATDQLAMFAEGRMKRVRFTDADVEAGVVRRYRPGAP